MSDEGWLYVVGRDDAKVLFRSKTNEQLDEFIAELHARTSSSDQALNCGPDWQQMHDHLTSLDDEGPLTQCLLGGRPLYQDTSRHVVLTRPDVVPHIATSLNEESDDELAASPNKGLLQSMRALFHVAAKERAAVLFVALQ